MMARYSEVALLQLLVVLAAGSCKESLGSKLGETSASCSDAEHVLLQHEKRVAYGWRSPGNGGSMQSQALHSEMAPQSATAFTSRAFVKEWLSGPCSPLQKFLPELVSSVILFFAFSLFRQVWLAGTCEDAFPILFACLFAGMLSYTLVIVDAYQLALSIGQGASFSGKVIGIYMTGSASGSCLLWCTLRKKPDIWKTKPQIVLFIAVFLSLAGAILYTACTFFHAVGGAILFARFLGGLGEGICRQLALTSIPHLTSTVDRPLRTLQMMLLNTTAIGLGPIIAASIHVAASCRTEPGGRPFAIIGPIQCLIAISASAGVVFYPDLQAAQDHLEKAHQSVNGSSPMGVKVLIIGCVMMSSLRAFVASSLEGASTLLLEKSFNWKLSSIGFAVGLTFLFIIPVKIVYERIGHHLSIVTWLRMAISLAILGAAMLHRSACDVTRTLLSSADCGFVILLADSILFPCMYFSDGLGIGIMQQHILEDGSIFDANHTALANMIFVGIGRSLGPWVSRAFLSAGNQDEYASLQCLSSILFFALFEAFVRPHMKT